MWSLGVLTAHLLTGQSILTQQEVPELSQMQIADRIFRIESELRDQGIERLQPRAVRFLQGLFVLDPKTRMTAAQALNHSWFKKPRSEAAAIEEVCRRITRFWKKRDDDPHSMIEALPSFRIADRAGDVSSRQNKSRRKIPDASSSPYFSLDRHLKQRPSSHRRTLLADLNKSGSQFITTKDSKFSRLRVQSTHGRDIFGKSQENLDSNSPDEEEEVSLAPTSPFPPEKTYGFCLSDPGSPPVFNHKSAIENSEISQQGSSKRVRFDSEDPEERALRDAVAREGPRWQTAKDFGDAIKKRRLEELSRMGKTNSLPLGTLAIRTSSKSTF